MKDVCWVVRNCVCESRRTRETLDCLPRALQQTPSSLSNCISLLTVGSKVGLAAVRLGLDERMKNCMLCSDTTQAELFFIIQLSPEILRWRISFLQGRFLVPQRIGFWCIGSCARKEALLRRILSAAFYSPWTICGQRRRPGLFSPLDFLTRGRCNDGKNPP